MSMLPVDVITEFSMKLLVATVAAHARFTAIEVPEHGEQGSRKKPANPEFVAPILPLAAAASGPCQATYQPTLDQG